MVRILAQWSHVSTERMQGLQPRDQEKLGHFSPLEEALDPNQERLLDMSVYPAWLSTNYRSVETPVGAFNWTSGCTIGVGLKIAAGQQPGETCRGRCQDRATNRPVIVLV